MTFSWLTTAAVVLILVEAGWLFFRKLRGFMAGIIGLVVLFGVSMRFPQWGLILTVIVFLMILGIEIFVMGNRESYTGIRVVFEGGGVRRGLNPVEAACLLGAPQEINYLLAVVGLLQNGFIQLEQGRNGEILAVVAEWLQTGGKKLDPHSRSQFRIESAFSHDKILQSYEDVLLETIEQNNGELVDFTKVGLWNAFLEKETYQKLMEYNFEETTAYYREFIVHRIAQVWRSPEQKNENILWYLFAHHDDELTNKTVQKVVQDFSPGWLPAQLDFFEFIRLLLPQTELNSGEGDALK